MPCWPRVRFCALWAASSLPMTTAHSRRSTKSTLWQNAVMLAVGVKGIALPMAALDGERYVANVLPLTSGARRRAGATYAAAAAVFVHKVALYVPSPPEVIGKLYKLTPTELRVLLAVMQVGGASEVAEALGIGRVHREDTSASPVRKDRHQGSKRPHQAGGELYQSTHQLSVAICALPFHPVLRRLHGRHASPKWMTHRIPAIFPLRWYSPGRLASLI